MALEGLNLSEMQSDIRKATLGQNFLCYHWEGCMWSMQCNVEFGYQLCICFWTMENLDLVGRSQGLPDANWLLASSPPLNTLALSVLLLYWKTFTSCFYKYFYVHIFWISTKPCVTPAEGMHKCVSVIIWLSVSLRIYSGLKNWMLC
jgi:hypothetical protein